MVWIYLGGPAEHHGIERQPNGKWRTLTPLDLNLISLAGAHFSAGQSLLPLHATAPLDSLRQAIMQGFQRLS